MTIQSSQFHFMQIFATVSFVTVIGASSLAFAQAVPEGDSYTVGDPSTSGQVNDVVPVLSIGQAGSGLAHGVNLFGTQTPELTARSYIEIEAGQGGNYLFFVVLPGSPSIRFTASTNAPTNGTVFTEFSKGGQSLTYDNGDYVFTSKHGTVARFGDTSIKGISLSSIEAPNGSVLRYDYTVSDLSSIRNSFGYQIKYQRNFPGANTVVGVNNRVEYCSPTAFTCSVGTQWPDGSNGETGSVITDALGRNYSLSRSGTLTSLSYPQSGATVTAQYGGSGYTTSMTRFGITTLTNTSYDNKGTALDTSDDTLSVTSTLPGGGTQTTVTLVEGGRTLSTTNTSGQTATYDYTVDNLVESVTTTRGNAQRFTYDARGNVTEVRREAGSTGGGNTADIVSTAGYLSSCTPSNRSYCNKPSWTEDATGARTDYTYHTQSGQIATIQAPSDGTNGRAITQYGYTQLSAQVKTSSGSMTASDAMWMLTSVKRFFGTPQQIDTTISYNAQKNLVINSVSVSGTGVSTLTTTYEYDDYGNQTAVDGPLPGTQDRTTTFYDALRRPIGTIGVDPDNGGPMLRSAVRYVRNDIGQVKKTETGTATGTTLASLNAMTVYETQDTTFNATTLRPSAMTLLDGIQAVSLMEYSYDSQGRVDCRALRMNPTSGATGNACQSGSPGIYGFDRITKSEYDTSSRPTRTIAGYGTGFVSEQTYTYWDFGPLKTANDGNGNQTYYTFDAHNRPYRTYFPKVSGSGYNASDYTLTAYDNFGRVDYVRQRDGQYVHIGHDSLSRTNFINAPGTAEDTSATYNIAGQLTQLSKLNSAIIYTYDAFGRQLSETSNGRTVGYQYDAYGRLERMNYPGTDNFHLTYDYYGMGRLKTIKERNSVQLAEYTYDTRGRRDELRRGPSSGGTYQNVTRYGYGQLSRLSSMETDIGGSTTTHDQLLSFTYAPSGQLHTQTASNAIYDPTPATYDEAFVINGLNQIASQGGQAFTYDTAGNLLTSPGQTYGYDFANRLTSVANTNGTTALTYDASSRLSTVGPSTGSKFGYSGQDMIEHLQVSDNALRERYVHGPGTDEPIARYAHTTLSSYTRSYYAVDHRGSIIGQTQGSASIGTNSYDAYGRPDSGNTGLYQYTGQVWIADLELYYYKARFYDPEIRRFLNADPIGYADGMNMYAYVGGDPINFTDPSGMNGEGEEDCEKTEEGCDEVIVTGPRFYWPSVPTYTVGGGGFANAVFGGALFAEFVVTGRVKKNKKKKRAFLRCNDSILPSRLQRNSSRGNWRASNIHSSKADGKPCKSA